MKHKSLTLAILILLSGCNVNSSIENSSLNVLILEKNDKLGKKLSMTGNGRCNLGNLDTNINNYFSSSSLENFKQSNKGE